MLRKTLIKEYRWYRNDVLYPKFGGVVCVYMILLPLSLSHKFYYPIQEKELKEENIRLKQVIYNFQDPA